MESNKDDEQRKNGEVVVQISSILFTHIEPSKDNIPIIAVPKLAVKMKPKAIVYTN